MQVNGRLKLNSLNIGFKYFKSLVEDYASVVIYKQFSLGNNTLNITSAIDLFFNKAKTNTL